MAAMIAATMISCEDNTGGNKDNTEYTGGSRLGGDVKKDITLDASVDYKLVSPLFVEDGASLTIPAGTKITGTSGFYSYILVLKGGKIFVNGTDKAPVTMTSKGKKDPWGGLIINGKAPLAGEKEGSTEINSDFSYGGKVANDNSGSITYLILGYTGSRNNGDTEHNGLTLNGVGNGTKIENVFVHDGADDGIEFYGGTVNVTNLLVVNADDDMFDFTQGYSGTLKNAYGYRSAEYKTAEDDPSGIEADGNLDGLNGEYTGQSNFKVENMTIDINLPYNNTDKTRFMTSGLKIRRGAKATIVNALITGTGYVKVLNDMADKKGDGDKASSISITNKLTTPADKNFAATAPSTEADYPNVKIVDGNTGCDRSLFNWTNYKF